LKLLGFLRDCKTRLRVHSIVCVPRRPTAMTTPLDHAEAAPWLVSWRDRRELPAVERILEFAFRNDADGRVRVLRGSIPPADVVVSVRRPRPPEEG